MGSVGGIGVDEFEAFVIEDGMGFACKMAERFGVIIVVDICASMVRGLLGDLLIRLLLFLLGLRWVVLGWGFIHGTVID